MNFNRKEHSRFIRCLDRAAEKNPLLWLPCVILIAFALAAERIKRRGAERAVNNNTQFERKPFFLRAVAVTLTLAFSLMLVPAASFDAFGEEYDPAEEQVIFDETSETEDTTVPDETSEPAETDVSDEAAEPDEVSEPEEASEPEEEELSEEETVNEGGIAPLAICAEHNYHTTWDWDDDYHKRTCAVCGYTESARHNMVVTSITMPTQTTGGTKYYKCTICPYTKNSSLPPLGNHDHRINDYWDWDSNSHWHSCQNPTCEAIENLAVHTFGDWENYNGIYHRRKCTTCNYYDIEWHEFEWKNEPDKHYEECKVCHAKRNEGEHSFKTNNDDTNHWQECSVSGCGYKKDVTGHNLTGNWQTTESIHRKGCTDCGYSTESASHDFNWNFDEDVEHWQDCPTCGWESAKVQHNLVWEHDDFESYGKHWQECVCGYETDEEEHDFGGEYFDEWTFKSDGENHWYECNDCGLKLDVEEHDLEWQYVDDEHWQLCKVCGKKFNTGEHLYKTSYDDKEHWGECICGRKESIEEHRFAEGIYTLAGGESYDPDDDDSADDRTPVKRYYCTSYCGYYYDEPINHTHKPGTVWKNDGSGHWHECTSCGARTDTAKHDYVITVAVQPVGTLAGTRVYNCTVCGYSYDEVIPAAEQIPVIGTGLNNGYNDRLPYITDAAEVRGWTNIAAYINVSPDGVTVPITMNGETDLPKDILKCIMYRDIALRIKMDGYSVWTVNGLDVTDPQTVSLRVAEKSDKIPAGLIGSLISELEPKEYKLYHGGDFGFKAELTLNVSKKYNGYYAELYHYNTKTQELEFVDESLVKNRRVTFDIIHASYYAVAFSSIPMYDDVSSGAGIFENSVPIETSAMPETGGVTIPAVKLPQIMRYSGKRRRYRILKKRRLDDLVFVL